MTDPDDLRRRMVDRVAADRYVSAGWREQFGQWRPSLLAVARHRFIPDTMWIENPNDGPPLVALHRQHDKIAPYFTASRHVEPNGGCDGVEGDIPRSQLITIVQELTAQDT